MAEVFGVAASIVGLACIGVQLSKSLYHFSSQTLGFEANHKINRIATNVTLFSAMLKQVAAVMQDSDSLHTPEAADTVMQIVKECELVFEDIRRVVRLPPTTGGEKNPDPGGLKRSMSFRKNARLYFEQPKVDALLAQLEYLKTTLSVLIQTLHLAAITAHIKETRQSLTEQKEEIRQERLHIETLIIARQLSVIILNQRTQQQASSAEGEDYVFASGRISPADSEATIDIDRPKLLTESIDSSLTLVRHEGGHLDFLDNAMPRDREAPSPIASATRDSVVDQLLSRWTRIPELCHVSMNKNTRPAEKEQRIKIGGEVASQGLRERRIPSPTVEPDEEAVSESEESDAQTLIASPPRARTQSGSSLLPPTASDGNRVGPPKATSLTLGPPRRSGPPPASTQSRPPPLTKTSSAKSRRLSAADPQRRSGVDPPMLTENSRMYSSPKPVIRELNSTASGPVPVSLPSPALAADLPAVPRGSLSAESSASSSTAPPLQRHSTSGSSSDSSIDSDESEYEIPWRITNGAYFWNFLDDKLVKTNDPEGTNAAYDWLWTHGYSYTEVPDHWISEVALKENKYNFRRIPSTEVGERESGSRWLILTPLRFDNIQALVDRTNKLDRLKSKASSHPAPSTVPLQASSQAYRQRSEPNVHAQAPLQTSQPSYFPPQPNVHHPPQARPNTLSAHWQSYPGPSAAAPQPLSAGPQPQHHLPPQVQQQRTVSFSDTVSQQNPAAPRSNLRRGSTNERSPRASIDTTNQQHPTQPSQQGQWQQSGYRPPSSQQMHGGPYQQQPQPQMPYGMPPPPTNVSHSSHYPTYPPVGTSYPAQPLPNGWSYPNPNPPTALYPLSPTVISSAPSRRTSDPRSRDRDRFRDNRRDTDSDSDSDSGGRPRSRSYHGSSSSKHKKKHDKSKADDRRTKVKRGAAAAGTLGAIWTAVAGLEGLDNF